MIDECVIDASVGIKVFLVEPDSPAADLLFSHLAKNADVRFYVPDLFYVECANILWKYVRRYAYPVEHARTDLNDLQEMPLTAVPTEGLVASALDIGMGHDLTVTDSCYVVLAQMLAVPLVSADQRLVQRAGHLIDARSLADMEF